MRKKRTGFRKIVPVMMICVSLCGGFRISSFAEENYDVEAAGERGAEENTEDKNNAGESQTDQSLAAVRETDAGELAGGNPAGEGDAGNNGALAEKEKDEGEENDGGKKSKGAPNVRIRRKKTSKVRSRSAFTVVLLLDNSSQDYPLANVELSLNPGDGLALQEDSATLDVGEIGAGEIKEVSVRMKAEKEISASAMALKVTMNYTYENSGGLRDGVKEARIMLQSIATEKEKEKEEKKLKSSIPYVRITQNGVADAIPADTDFEIAINIDNFKQSYPLSNVEFSIAPGSELILRETGATFFLDTIEGKSSKQLVIRMKTGKKLTAAAAAASVTLKYTYRDRSDSSLEQGTKEEQIFIPVIPTEEKEEKELAIPMPNVIVSKYSYGEQVAAGNSFNLHLEIKNTSSTTIAENMLMSLETGEALSITDSSNTFYITQLKPQETLSKEVTVKALANGKPENSKIDINFKYEYISQKTRTQASATEKLAIPLVQPDRFIVNPAQIMDTVRKDSEATISFPYVNKGKGTIYNVEARLEGAVEAVETYKYLGNYESGSSGTIDFLVTPRETGTIPVTVSITYEDSSNVQQKLDFPIKLSVQEPAADEGEEGFGFEDDYEMAEKPVNKKMLAGLFIIFLILTLAILAALKFKKRKKHQKEQILLQQLEEEE